MIIQVLLLGALTFVFLYALSQRRRSFSVSIAMALIALMGGGLVLAPDIANLLAHLIGVGRGADLILYCFIVLMLGTVFNIHLRLRAERETTTELARAIAVLSATRPVAKT